MRLLGLQLLRFGPFTDLDLDFESSGKSFHVIFGSNEAGKSTALRAISGLLFGIPEITRDDYFHRKADLRIGASLENRAGKRLDVVRRKGRKDTLLDLDGKPLDEVVLTAWLGGVGRELYETMFGLSHETLVLGGQDLLAGKGELGESLFGAGIGVRSIHALRTSLREEADSIFTSGAQKRPLNLVLKAFQEAKRRSIQLSLKPREWQELQEKLQTANEQFQKCEQQRQETLTELNRLKRLQRVLPRIRKREELLDRKEKLGEVRLVPESSTGERTEAQRTLRDTDVRQQKLLDEKEQCETERAKLQVPEKLLTREVAIEELRERLGAHKKAMQDLPTLQGQVASAQDDVRGILQELRYDQSLDKVDQLRIGAATQARIRALGQDHIRLETARSKAEKDLLSIQNTIRTLERERDGLPLPRDASALQRVVAEARRHGDQQAQLRKLETDLRELENKAKHQLSALLLWHGSLDQVEGLPRPLAETVDRFRTQFDQMDKKREHAEATKRNVVERLERISSSLMDLEAHGAVPTEEELKGSRAERDKIWWQIRPIWLKGESAGEEPAEALAARYEGQVRSADDVADRLWHDADRAAKHLTITADRKRCEAEYNELGQQVEELRKNADALREEWRTLWKPAGIDPLPPGEMRNWLSQHEKLVELAAQWRERGRARDMFFGEIQEHRRRCSQELATLGEPQAADDESLSALLSQAEAVVEKLQKFERTRGQILRDLEKAESSRQEHEVELARCQETLDQWRDDWKQAVQPLGLDANATIEEVDAILNGLTRLFQKVGDVRRDQTRIDHIEQDARLFTVEVTELARECAPDLEGVQASEAAAELVSRLNKGKDALKERNNLDKRLQQIHKELSDLKRDREDAQTTLDQLIKSASCNALEELEKAERDSREYREITSKLSELEEQLLGEGVPLKELVGQAQKVDPDALPAHIRLAEEKSAGIVQESSALAEQIGGVKTELGAMDGRRSAADAAAEAEEALSHIKGYVESYTRMKLATLLLDREIERYREQNQGPILRRAGEIFSRMTVGAFTGLTTGFSDSDQLVLLCIRANGDRVPVEGLSDGTRDQLYLALRLASIEQHVAGNEPLPLVIDDVLINFDDRRAQATLELLSEFAEKTQVLFFTHHTKLLELAREAVPAKLLKEHDLDNLGATQKKMVSG